MMETLRGAWDATLSFSAPYYAQAAAFARTLDPVVWWTLGGVVLLLFLLWLLLRRREPRKDGRPEVLLSLGTIAAPDGLAGSNGLHSLRLTVSNLNPYAVQVLELALKTPEMDVPVTAEVAAVVPPEDSVMLEHPFSGLAGDTGRLNVYFYTAGSRRIYRLQAPFALEPWNNRYKISPLDQSVVPVRQLASAGVSRVQEQTWLDTQGREPQREYQVREPQRDQPVRYEPEVAVARPARDERAVQVFQENGREKSKRRDVQRPAERSPRHGNPSTKNVGTKNLNTEPAEVYGETVFPDEF